MTSDAGTGIRLDDDQRLAWLRLIRSENIGPVTFRELINHFGSGLAAIDAVPELSRRGGRTIRLCPLEDAERERDGLRRMGARLIAMGEPDYPALLRHISDAPPLIAVRGDPGCFGQAIVSIVGSRNASVAGRKFAAQLAAGLGAAECTVASGLARGIDAAAHEASLTTGTIAVLAGGLDHIYPPENVELAERIVDNGGVQLSEMPLGWVPRGRDFPRRNRLVSGVALGVVVIEAAKRSGSLITARRAGDQGRQVFAVPGSPLDPRAAGSNQLIKDGAHMVTELADILSDLEPMLERRTGLGGQSVEEPSPPDAEPMDIDDDERATIISALGPTPVEIDEIIRFTGLKPAIIHLVLLELALAGRLERHSGQRVSLV